MQSPLVIYPWKKAGKYLRAFYLRLLVKIRDAPYYSFSSRERYFNYFWLLRTRAMRIYRQVQQALITVALVRL